MVEEVCGFFSSRRLVMRKTMDDVRKLESEGTPVTNKRLSKIMKQNWADVKAEQDKLCPGD